MDQTYVSLPLLPFPQGLETEQTWVLSKYNYTFKS